MDKLSVIDLDLKGKRALIRVDYNVPLDDSGQITDDSRIEASLPTLRYVLSRGASIILMSHLGRPKGKRAPEFSLAPCAASLSKMLGKPVQMATDCIGKDVEKQVSQLKPGDVLLLENLRFYDAEEHPEKDPTFAQKLATYGDVYINDAFGTAHRAHSSTATIAKFFPGRAAAGFLLEREIKFLGETLLKPRRPFFAILGGAKVSSKLGIVKALLTKVDSLFIGGAMAYTFLKAKGIQIGDSLCEEELLNEARATLASFEEAKVPLYLPEDHLVANSLKEGAQTAIRTNQQGILKGWQGVDIGPKTLENYKNLLKDGMTIFWNGPVGIFEVPAFATGTKAIASTLASLNHATTVVGGGDSIAAIRGLNLAHSFSHLSTGGGASLEYIEYGTLPGIEALSPAHVKKFA